MPSINATIMNMTGVKKAGLIAGTLLVLLLGGIASVYLWAIQPVTAGNNHGPSALILKGDMQAALGNHSAAITLYTQALEQEPEYHELHSRLGFAYYATGNKELSIKHFRRYAALKPNDPNGHYNLAHALYMSDRYPEARAEYDAALALDATHAASMNGIGNIYNDKRDYDTALAWYQQAIAADPNLAEAYENIGWVEQTNGNLEQALDAFQHWARLEPTNPLPYASLAYMYSVLGDEANAKTARERYLALQQKKAAR